jgi:hypothetical protein
MVDHFTLENMILHGTRDGLAADSSWRNKSENRAAVTFIIAVDENKHLLPGVCESHLTFVMYADHFLIRVCPPICKCANKHTCGISGGHQTKSETASRGNHQRYFIFL